MPTFEETRFALDDARQRQAALLNLIYSIERQASDLLRLYVTLALAAASAATASVVTKSSILSVLGAPLLAAVFALSIGSWFCFRAMKSAPVCLPGRGADFWIWAQDTRITFEDAAKAYLTELKDRQTRDQRLNRLTAEDLAMAKRIGIATPIIAIIVAALTEAARGLIG